MLQKEVSRRESNTELFRIVATLMIIIGHGNEWFLNLHGVDSWYEGGWAYALTRTSIQSIVCIGVDCFILISGYYSIRPKFSSIVNIFTLLLFFYVGSYLTDCWLGADLSWQQLIYHCLAFSKNNWYIQSYLVLMLFSPLLNAFVEKVSSAHLFRYLIIFALFFLYFGCIRDTEEFLINRGYSSSCFVFVYLVGRYLRVNGEDLFSKYKTCTLLCIWIALSILIAVIFLSGLHEQYRLASYCSPLVVVSAAMLFLLFRRIRLNSTIVNYIASSCLAVFILHTCSPFAEALARRDYWSFMHDSLFIWLGKQCMWFLIVFLIAVTLDKIRATIFKPLINYSKKFNHKFITL